MSGDCTHDPDRRKLVRDGTAQGERFPAALDPATVPVHGRSTAEALRFACEYSRHLVFHSEHSPAGGSGDWRPFFDADVSAVLALASLQDVQRYRRVLLRCFQYLEDARHAGETELVRRHFGLILAATGTLAWRLDWLARRVPAGFALRATLSTLVKTRLGPALRRLVACCNEDLAAAAELRLLGSSALALEPEEDYRLSILGLAPLSLPTLLDGSAADSGAGALGAEWLEGRSWDEFRTQTSAPSPFGGGTSVFERANLCVRHALFSGACDAFLRAYARLAEAAQAELGRTLAAYPRHAPHYALFLAFLRAFDHARHDIDGLAARHLDHYYRKVLRLAERGPEPARAHVVLELAKGAASCELAAQTEFKAGKDGTKKPVVFASRAPFVANRAAVAALLNLWRDGDAIRVDAEARAEEGSWHPFENEGAPGSFGFAVASHYLHLAEGTRTIRLALHVAEDETRASGAPLAGAFVCRLTTAAGWLELAPSTLEFVDTATLVVELTLDGDQPAVSGYDAKKHASVYETALPVLEVRLRAVEGMLETFAALENVRVESIDLEVRVLGLRSLVLSSDVGPLDASKPFQPFGSAPSRGSSLVIGCPEAFRKRGLDQATLRFGWRELPGSSRPVRLQCLTQGAWSGTTQQSLLAHTPETLELTGDLAAFNPDDDPQRGFGVPFGLGSTSGYTRLVLQSGFGHEDYAGQLTGYVIQSVKFPDFASVLLEAKQKLATLSSAPEQALEELGTVTDDAREILDRIAGEVGSDAQSVMETLLNWASGDKPQVSPSVLAEVISRAQDLSGKAGSALERLRRIASGESAAGELMDNAATEVPSMPALPFTPLLESLTLDYHAAQSIACGSSDATAFAARNARFYHVTSFGLAEQHACLRPEPRLLPQFAHVDADDPQRPSVPHVGELYIGLSGVVAPQNVSLLFQVEDGSASPLAHKPSPHLHFSYLRGNDWIPLRPDEVDERTSELLASGTISISVPQDATTNDTLLPGQRVWLRLAVAECSAAVCRLLDVRAQALELCFSDRGNDPAFLEQPVAAGTVTKLVEPKAELKSVTQPFASFGGRAKELPQQFRTRVSERLRHKDRAVALWDLERLVLAAFPGIHRAKCQNHTRYEPGGDGGGRYRELAPGHVTLLTIPAVNSGHAADPLRPYTSLGVLEEIEQHLAPRLSGFAVLHVTNPDYEELRVACKVRLRAGRDEGWCLAQLKQAITRFLAPWAYDPASRPCFGGKVDRSRLIRLVEQLEYVDYVTDFQLYQRLPDGSESGPRASVEGSRSVAVLTSVPAEEHDIQVIHEADEAGVAERCGCST